METRVENFYMKRVTLGERGEYWMDAWIDKATEK